MSSTESTGFSPVPVEWRTATASAAGNCVQVATTGAGILVRDSKNPHLPARLLANSEWIGLIAGIKRGSIPAG
jgi:hypothetical protein